MFAVFVSVGGALPGRRHGDGFALAIWAGLWFGAAAADITAAKFPRRMIYPELRSWPTG
jgi:hypothetical protein